MSSTDSQTQAHTKPPAPDAWADIGMLGFLQLDQRPTFIVDLEAAFDPNDNRLPMVFYNPAMRSIPLFLDMALGVGRIPPDTAWIRQFLDFKRWAISGWSLHHDRLSAGDLAIYYYHGLLWNCFNIARRWRIICCSYQPV